MEDGLERVVATVAGSGVGGRTFVAERAARPDEIANSPEKCHEFAPHCGLLIGYGPE